MKMSRWMMAAVVLTALGLSGCSIKHPVAKDYARYLGNNAGMVSLPASPMEANYFLTPETQNHKYEFRAATTGYANLWIVEFGRMLDDTLQTPDVQKAFGRLTRQATDDSTDQNLFVFDLVSYQFYDFNAHIELKISVFQDGTEVFTELYRESGQPQGGKMFWGGAMAMKNAIQQSTKYALDDVLEEFIGDLNKEGLSGSLPAAPAEAAAVE